MKKHIIFFIFIAFAYSSCEKVIDLDLETTSPYLVIQGNIYDQPGPYIVKLSKTVDFDQTNDYPSVSGALVIISDDHGVVDTLKETDSGTYQTSKIEGIPGYTYTLSVTSDGVSYTSSSTMPPAIDIDTIYVEKATTGNSKQVTIQFNDPANVDNYYRVLEIVNNQQQNDFNVITDKVYDGKTMFYYLLSSSRGEEKDKIMSGDYITVQLECIDKGVYEFFRTAQGADNQSASPSNPSSNITNGALGYFNACSYRTSSIVFP
jgi:hypothetical protein